MAPACTTRAPSLPDHYKLTFTKQGFQTLVRGPITLEVGVQGINAQLQVGAESTEVTVNTDVPLLDTESGAMSRPLRRRPWSNCRRSAPTGRTSSGCNPVRAGTPENSSSAVQPNGGQVAVNGNLPFETYLADGATTTLPMSTNSDVTIFETTSEVKISDSGFSAQYGVGNVVYNQITKGGTDRFHGSGYEYFQNDALNAAPYAFRRRAKYRSCAITTLASTSAARSGRTRSSSSSITTRPSSTAERRTASSPFQPRPCKQETSAPPAFRLFTTRRLRPFSRPEAIPTTFPAGPIHQPCPCVIRKTFLSEYGVNAIPAASD